MSSDAVVIGALRVKWLLGLGGKPFKKPPPKRKPPPKKPPPIKGFGFGAGRFGSGAGYGGSIVGAGAGYGGVGFESFGGASGYGGGGAYGILDGAGYGRSNNMNVKKRKIKSSFFLLFFSSYCFAYQPQFANF